MDQTIVLATEAFLRDELAKATSRVSQLEESHARLAQRDMNTAAALNAIKENLKDWTRSELSEENISMEQAQALAKIGDFTLSQNYDVTMTVDHTFTICVESGEDIDDVLSTIEFNVNSYHVELMNEDSNVVDTNYDEVDY
jgi:small-conductance mechanosensitive channel